MIPSDVEILDIVILQSHTDQIGESLYCFIGSGCTEILVDHVRNLSSSQESVVFLSTLFFDTYSLSKMYLRVVKLFYYRRNHRIKHIEIMEIVSLHNR